MLDAPAADGIDRDAAVVDDEIIADKKEQGTATMVDCWPNPHNKSDNNSNLSMSSVPMGTPTETSEASTQQKSKQSASSLTQALSSIIFSVRLDKLSGVSNNNSNKDPVNSAISKLPAFDENEQNNHVGKSNPKSKSRGGASNGANAAAPTTTTFGFVTQTWVNASRQLLFRDLNHEEFDEDAHQERVESENFQQELKTKQIPPMVEVDNDDDERSIMTELTDMTRPRIVVTTGGTTILSKPAEQPVVAAAAPATPSLMNRITESGAEMMANTTTATTGMLGAFNTADLVKTGTTLFNALTIEEFDEEAEDKAKAKLWRQQEKERKQTLRKAAKLAVAQAYAAKTQEQQQMSDATPEATATIKDTQNQPPPPESTNISSILNSPSKVAKSLWGVVYQDPEVVRHLKEAEAEQYYGFAEAQCKEHKWRDALQNYNQSLNLQRELYGQDDIRVACSLVGIGDCLTQIGEEMFGAYTALEEASHIFEHHQNEKGQMLVKESMALLMQRQNELDNRVADDALGACNQALLAPMKEDTSSL